MEKKIRVVFSNEGVLSRIPVPEERQRLHVLLSRTIYTEDVGDVMRRHSLRRKRLRAEEFAEIVESLARKEEPPV